MLILDMYAVAEEGGHGKIRLLNAGGYEGMDACVMWEIVR